MSYYAKILSLSYDSAEATKSTSLKAYYRSVRLIKETGTVNPGKDSYITNVLLCGNCIDPEKRKLYVMYIDTYYQAAWIIEIGIDDRVQKVVYYDKDNNIGFNSLFKIYNARVANGKLIFTDNKNPIYQIDIERAKASYYYGIGYNNFPTTEWNESAVYLQTQIVSFGKYFYKAVVANSDTEPGNDETIWTRLCSIEDAYYSMNIENFYFGPIPPKDPPIVTYISDDSRKINNLKQTLYQFAYRFVYMDWRKSTFSPASLVPLPQSEEETSTGLANEWIALNNGISIQVNLGGEEVRAIEVVARSSEDPSTWFLVETIEKFEDQEKGGIMSKITNAAYVEVEISILQPSQIRNFNAPLAPVAITAERLLSTSFVAMWVASAGASGYFLDVATDAAFTTYVTGYHNRDIGNSISFWVRPLTSNTTYYYRLRAYNLHGLISGDSNIITVIIVLDAPIAVEASDVFTTGFTAKWQAVSGATGYYLDVAEDIAFAVIVAGYNNKDVGNVLSDIVLGLNPNDSYFYRVRAYNALGTSVNSNIIDQRTETSPDDVIATAATSVTLTTFMANWNAAVGIGTNGGYLLDIATDIAFVNKINGYDNRFVGDVRTYIARILSPNTTYYYRVKGITARGVMSLNYSNIITASTKITPPLALDATGVFGTGLTANWKFSGGNVTGYRLDVSTVSNFATFIAGYNNLDVGLVLFKDITGLDLRETYFYRVRAYNALQTSDNSNVVSQRTNNPLSAPVITGADTITVDSFIARWDPILLAAGYYFDVATTADFSSGFIYHNQDSNSYPFARVQGLSASTRYYVRARTYDSHGVISDYSNILQVITSVSAPVAIQATNIGQTVMRANWEAVVGAIGYRLDVSAVNDFSTLLTGYNNLNVGSVVGYDISGLTVNTAYYYRVRAYTSLTTSANSNVISQRTQIPPDMPVALPASNINPTYFYANWEAAGGVISDLAGYYLDIATDIGFVNKIAGYDNRDIGNVITYIARILLPGTNYFYRIMAYNAHGVTSSYSNIISVTTSAQLVASPPVAIAASVVLYNGFTANWNVSALASFYMLDVSTNSSFSSFVSGYNRKLVGNVTSFAVTGLTADVTYYYRVRAINISGTSTASNTITQKTLSSPPTILVISPSSWDFGGSGPTFKKLITVTTNGASWGIEWPSNDNFIHVYTYVSANEIELYYDGPLGSDDYVTFYADGPGGHVSVEFYGRWL